jgi:TonB-linked SusC/RagA family outer membrane protein
MRLLTTVILLVMGLTTTAAPGYSQKITLEMKNARLEAVLNQIGKITGYSFIYEKNLVKKAKKLDVSLENANLQEAMDRILKDQAMEYNITDKYIVISPKKPDPAPAVLLPPANPDPPPAIVAGVVKDSAGATMSGVSVSNKTTGRGTSTNKEGAFKIEAKPGDVLVFSFVGYESQSVTIGAETQLTVVLKTAPSQLGTIVITALGVKRSERSLTYATQQIGGDELNNVKTDNLMNSLNGKVAGVTISPSASGVGGSVKVLLRGSRSANGNNQPLYVIDGIPISNGSNANGQPNNTYGGTPDGGDGISNLNPEDIAGISVLEGASAAALYGSQAENGVILITTKKGRAGAAVVHFSSSFESQTTAYKPAFQNSYGPTSPGAPDSWGSRLTTGAPDNLKDFFQTGTNWTNAIDLSSGSDKAQTYFSYANTSARGLEPGNKLERNNFTLRETGHLLNDRLIVDGNVNYINQQVNNSPALGLYSNPLVSLYTFPRGLDISPYKNHYLNADSTGFARQNWPFLAGGYESPWWIVHRQPSVATRNRILFNGSASYKVAGWLNVQVRGNLDHIQDAYENDLYSGTIPGYNALGTGRLTISNQTTEQKYGDAIANLNAPAWGAFKLDGLVGYSITDNKTTGYSLSGDLSTPDFFTSGNTVVTLPSNGPTTTNTTSNAIAIAPNHSQLQALFANANLSFRNWAYLTLTGRNDWSSNLAFTPNASYFYPSAGLSLILTQMLQLPTSVSYAKLRGTWAQVGNTVPPYLTYIQNTQSAAGQLIFNTADAFRTLKPERTNSTELGTDWRFLDNRLTFSFTWYKTNTHNQYFPIQPVIASLYSTGYVNAGNIQNSGIEFIVGFQAVRASHFTWTTSVNGAANKNKVIDVDSRDSLNSFVLTGSYNNAYEAQLNKGGKYGDMYGYTFARDAKGRIQLSGTAASGYKPVINSTFQYIGNPSPKFQLGWSNDFTMGDFTLSLLVDGKFGGQVLSLTQAVLDQNGVSKVTGDARNAGGVKINGVDSGNAVTSVDAKDWYTTIGGIKGITGAYVYSATVVRLREAALGYKLPLTKAGFFKGAKLSLIGRNLLYFYKKAPFDPELTMSTGNGLPGVDVFNQPATRNVGLNLNLTF